MPPRLWNADRSGCVASQYRTQPRVHGDHVALEVEVAQLVVGALEHDVRERALGHHRLHALAWRGTRQPSPPATRPRFRARWKAACQPPAVGRPRTVVDRRNGCGLLRAEAVIRRRVLADERARIEAARVWCHEDTIRYAVAPVARRHNRLLQYGELRRRDMRRRPDQGLRVPHEGHHEARPRRCGRTRHDAVVVVRVALRFHQRLPPTVGARCEVRPTRRRTVEGGDHRLRLHRHLVNTPVPVIDHSLGVAERPACIGGTALVAGIGRRGRVAASDGLRDIDM